MNTGRTHFKKGTVPWNKGTKGLMKAWNKGMEYHARPAGYKHSPETIKKMTIANQRAGLKRRGILPKNLSLLIGKNHWNWKGGLEFRKKNNERNDSAYGAWSREVKKRDNYKCKMANENCYGYTVAHHILPWAQYPEERYNVNNGIVLCQYHHPKKRVEEQKMIPVLQELVLKN